MKTIPIPSCTFLVALIVSSAAVLVGCGSGTTPPGPKSVFGFVETDIHFDFLIWEEGLAVLFVDNLTHEHSSGGHSSTGDPIHRQTGWARSKEGDEYRWEIRTSDGRTAEIEINNVDYDFAKGTVFAVRHDGKEVAVEQLDLDLSNLSSVSDCQTFIAENRTTIAFPGDEPGRP